MAEQLTKSKPKRSRQQRRTRATRQKLLDAARAVFAEKGLDLARIDEITDRADVGKGTFYYHFKSGKEELIRHLIKGVLGELEALIDQKCSGISDLAELLDTLIGTHIEFFCNRWEDFVLYFQGRNELTLEFGYTGIETPFIDYIERIEALLASVQYRLPKLMLRRIACAVAGFVSGYYSFAVIASQGEDIDETFRSLRGAMVASLTRFIRETAPSGGTSGSKDEVK